MNKITIYTTVHFENRIRERFKFPESSIVQFLNKNLSEGIYIKNTPSRTGVFFPNAGCFVPIVKDIKNNSIAKTITSESFALLKIGAPQYIKVNWKDILP